MTIKDTIVPESRAADVTKLNLDHQRKLYLRMRYWKINATVNQEVYTRPPTGGTNVVPLSKIGMEIYLTHDLGNLRARSQNGNGRKHPIKSAQYKGV